MQRVYVKQCAKMDITINARGDASAQQVDKSASAQDAESGDGEPAAARDFNYKLTTNEKLFFS